LHVTAGNGSRSTIRKLEDWVLHTRWRAPLACGILGLCLAIVTTATIGFPPPRIHDEFSYLLSGETIARGRLANPPHPMAHHFESFHVLQEPTYASKYPLAPGLFIAAGIKLVQLPVAGIWLSFAFLVAAINWMLRPWVRPRWALWGAVAAALWLCGRHAWAGYWTYSFWGGNVPALGGALILGGLRRLASTPTIPASLALGSGVALLALSRPFEGLLFSLVPAGAVAWILVRHLRARAWRPVLTTVAPLATVLAGAALLMGLHNAKTTGSALKPPYLAYDEAYASSPHLLFQARPPMPAYRVAAMESFYTKGSGFTSPPAGMVEFAKRLPEGFGRVMRFYVPWFSIPLLFVAAAFLRGWPLLAVATVGTTAVAMVLTLYPSQPHYAAPAAAAWCIILTGAARRLSQLDFRGYRAGRILSLFVMACIAGSALLQFTIGVALRGRRANEWHWQRQTMERTLAKSGRHLVIVEYGAEHDPNKEWVFNHADIDGAPVVWARSIDDSSDAALQRYFAARTPWRLQIADDGGPFTLQRPAPVAGSLRQAGRR
jgi:hypothetical protein